MIQVCTAAIICHGKLLLGRKKTDDKIISGEWCLPGGKKLEQESPYNCVIREIEEECNCKIRPICIIGEWDFIPDSPILKAYKQKFHISVYLSVFEGPQYITTMRAESDIVELGWFGGEELESAMGSHQKMTLPPDIMDMLVKMTINCKELF